VLDYCGTRNSISLFRDVNLFGMDCTPGASQASTCAPDTPDDRSLRGVLSPGDRGGTARVARPESSLETAREWLRENGRCRSLREVRASCSLMHAAGKEGVSRMRARIAEEERLCTQMEKIMELGDRQLGNLDVKNPVPMDLWLE
jgi:hypothetical protein